MLSYVLKFTSESILTLCDAGKGITHGKIKDFPELIKVQMEG